VTRTEPEPDHAQLGKPPTATYLDRLSASAVRAVPNCPLCSQKLVKYGQGHMLIIYICCLHWTAHTCKLERDSEKRPRERQEDKWRGRLLQSMRLTR
jgi:hypothetical protein